MSRSVAKDKRVGYNSTVSFYLRGFITMKRVLFGVLFAAVTVASSQASEWLYYTGMGFAGTGSVTGRDTASGLPGNYNHGNVYMGQIKVKYLNYGGVGTPGTGLFTGSNINTYCITPNEVLGSPSNPWRIDTPFLAGGGNTMSDFDRIGRLVANDNLATGTGAAGGADAFSNSSAISNDIATAFQLALWNVVQDAGGNTFSTNKFVIGGGVDNDIEDFFNKFMTIANNTNLTGRAIFFQPNPLDSSQILVTNTGGGGGQFTPTPEPFTMGLGIAAAAAFARRRIKAKKLA